MNKILLLFSVTLLFLSCTGTDKKDYDLKNVKIVAADEVVAMAGEKQYTAVYFWATWCAPCRSSLKKYMKPILDTVQRDDMQVLVVALSKKPEKVQEIISAAGIEQTTYVVNDYMFDNALADKVKMNSIIQEIADDMERLNKVPIVLVVDNEKKVYGDTYSIYDLSQFLKANK